jgi:16S rRNA (cytosine1402-N4)-methyltransferase
MDRPADSDVPEHVSVLSAEAVDLAGCRPGAVIVDSTVGLGGHSAQILDRIQPGGTLIGIDRDKDSLEIARERLAGRPGLRLVHDNFKNLPLVLNGLGYAQVDGILVDLGISSYQLMSMERGFSFQTDAMLDMRMDRGQQLTAADLVNDLQQDELADLIYQYGEEPASRRIAAAIVDARQTAPVLRCKQLADIVSRAVRVRGFQKTHPATRTFQALRIAVNGELEGLEEFIDTAIGYLRPGGRLVMISFHSLEDRIVKRSMRRHAGQCICDRPPELCVCPRKRTVRLVTGRAVRPGDAELDANPRSRSARMRCAERLAGENEGRVEET